MIRTQANIYLKNFEHNINIVKEIAEKKKICLAVKANAYGHGAVEIAQKAIHVGVEYLSVATVAEGIQLRKANINTPILLLSLCSEDEIDDLVLYRLTPLVADIEFVTLLCKSIKSTNKQHTAFPVHIKIDTGMARHGCGTNEVITLANFILSKKELYIEGTCTHLAVSDSFKRRDIAFTKMQIKLFQESVNLLRAHDINPGIIHCAASGGILYYKDAHFDMVRPGILAYGYYPSSSFAHYYKGKDINLLPVMELVTSITALKKIKKGQSVSYGRTWKTRKDTYIATIPIGYADGLNRKLSGVIKVQIKEKLYSIVGRICMDQCVVHLGPGNLPHRWSKVVLFGPNKVGNTAQNFADILKTIPYEVLCGISARVERVYIN